MNTKKVIGAKITIYLFMLYAHKCAKADLTLMVSSTIRPLGGTARIMYMH